MIKEMCYASNAQNVLIQYLLAFCTLLPVYLRYSTHALPYLRIVTFSVVKESTFGLQAQTIFIQNKATHCTVLIFSWSFQKSLSTLYV